MARNIGDAERITVPTSNLLCNFNTASILCWFRIPANADYSHFYSEYRAFNRTMFVRLENTGVATLFWRQASTIATITGGTTFDDGNWHRLLAVRRASNDFELYVDETSQGTSTNAPGLDSSASYTIEVGNQAETGPLNEGLKGDLARFILLSRAVTPNEAKGILYGAHPGLNRLLWYECGYGDPEPDFSGNGLNGTFSGTSVVPHAPMGYPFWSGNGGANAYALAQQTVEPGFIDQTPTIFSPQVNLRVEPGFIDQTPTIFNPTVTPGSVTVEPGLIDQTPQVFDPTVTPGSVTVEPGLIDQTPQVFDPTVSPQPVTVEPGFIDLTPQVFDPQVNLRIEPGFIDQTPQVFNPTVSTGGGGQTVEPGFIDQTPQVYNPAVTTGAVTVSPGLIDLTPQVFDPVVTTGSVTVEPGLIDQTPTIFAPQINLQVAVGFIDQSPSVFAPTVTPGAATIQPGFIDQTPTVYAPSITGGAPIFIAPTLEAPMLVELPIPTMYIPIQSIMGVVLHAPLLITIPETTMILTRPQDEQAA